MSYATTVRRIARCPTSTPLWWARARTAWPRAITLAEAGLSVEVIEGADTPRRRVSYRCRQATPGSATTCAPLVHPLLLASPFFARPAFDDLRDRLCHPEFPFAHPLADGRAAVNHRSVDETAASWVRAGRPTGG